MSGGLYGKEGDGPLFYTWESDEDEDEPMVVDHEAFTPPWLCNTEGCTRPNRYHRGPCTIPARGRYL